MSSAVTIRVAAPGDAAALQELARAIAMPGAMALCMPREPDFFAALEPEGEHTRVIVGEHDGRLVGYGTASAKRVFVNGTPRRMGYLSGLRLLPQYRGGTLLARGYRLLREEICAQLKVRHFLTTIMEDNAPARQVLTSGRGGLPVYHDLGPYLTCVVPARAMRCNAADVEIVPGTALGSAVVAGALAKLGAARQFFPCYEAAHIGASRGLLRGLPLGNFAVCVRGGRIAGLAAWWDQTAFRQTVVRAYHGVLRVVRPWYNLWARVWGGGALPAPGAPVPMVYAACIAVEHDDAGIFAALLEYLRAMAHAAGRSFLMTGVAQDDPLTPVARRAAQLVVPSRAYLVSWDDVGHLLPPAGRAWYLELASL